MTKENKQYLSLKQKEQRLGYLKANKKKEDAKKEEAVEDFQKIFSNDGKGSLIIDRNNDIKQSK